MKQIFWISLLSATLSFSAVAGQYSFTSAANGQPSGSGQPAIPNGGVVPDGSLNGLASSISTGSMLPPTITSVTVSLNITGGNNGDLYVYLEHNGQVAVLMNRVGVGSSNPFGSIGSGISVTFDSSSMVNIHGVGNGPLSGTYAPDGQLISPLSSASAFSNTGGPNGLNNFTGANANGTWTLFVADTVSGGGNSTLVSWGMTIDAVPEPVNMALGIFGAFAVSVVAVRKLKKAAASGDRS